MIYIILQNLVFVVVFVLTFLHDTYAPWTRAPDVPPYYRYENCEGWLRYHKFTDAAVTNLRKSITRDRAYDQDVCIWAALYASFLTIFRQFDPIDTNIFCEYHKMYYGIKDPYIALKDSQNTCIGWINLYGFSAANSPTTTWNLVSGRSTLEDNYIAIWPALYAQYISGNINRASKTQEEFCKKMGHSNNNQLPFVSIYATFKTCQEWIEFAGYTNDLEHNMEKVTYERDDYKDLMNEFVIRYSEELLQYISLNLEENYEHTYHLMNNSIEIDFQTPEKFCLQLDEIGIEKRRYRPL